MKLVIGYLYYDLMNLYGDVGNIKVLEYHLKKQGVNVSIKKLSISDDIDFDELDLVYIGSSTEENRNLCLEHLMKYKDKIKEVIEDGKFFLVTGNALGLFGKTLYDKESLGVFDFEVKTSKRVVKEIVTKSNLCKSDIYGFMNHEDEVVFGLVNNLFDNEGVFYNNFYGTYMIGPILSRNSEFTTLFIKSLIKSKNKNFGFKKFNFDLDKKAYEEYIVFKKNKIHIK